MASWKLESLQSYLQNCKYNLLANRTFNAAVFDAHTTTEDVLPQPSPFPRTILGRISCVSYVLLNKITSASLVFIVGSLAVFL